MKNFFASLTDRSFTTFITRPVASVLYLISMILIAIGVGLGVIAGFFLLLRGEIVSFLVGIVFVPLAGLLILILTRLFFESGVALVLIAENTKR